MFDDEREGPPGSEFEPADPDPEAALPDYEPEEPAAPDPSAAAEAKAADVDPAVANEFWAAVVLANVAVGGVGVGALVWYFRGEAFVGGGLVLVGVVALLLTARRVRAFGRSDDADESAADGDDGADGVPRRNA